MVFYDETVWSELKIQIKGVKRKIVPSPGVSRYWAIIVTDAAKKNRKKGCCN